MDAERYRKLKEILAEAASRRGAEREQYLDSACAADAALRREIEDLLRSAGPATILLPTSDTTTKPGRRIGPFELIERIGEGGMGAVWRAQQTRPVRREVALKLLKAGLDSPEALARFEAERQALALMDHDCIAKVYEAGTTEDGFPYFAMEYVRGEPINAYCDRRRLTVRERLELVARVCGGVQHAHQKAVIHRDLKPSNILVTGDGPEAMPKIIDFGVAKATGARLTDRPMVTHLGDILGTPEYMSPEQVQQSAVEVDTRADVYALGVLLYELLSGSLPFDSQRLRSEGWDGIRRILRDEEPLPPSVRLNALEHSDGAIVAARRRTELAVLHHAVQGDLDWIVTKAMDKQPGRRYESASQLADDIRRHLAHEPVLARPPSTAYRLSKFLRRHRAASAVVSSVAILVVVFGALMAVQASRIARERDRAQSEARRAEAMSDYMLQLFESTDPAGLDFEQGEIEVTRKILRRGLDRADALKDEPEAQAEMLGAIALVFLNLGLPDDAREVAARAMSARPDAPDDITVTNLMTLGRALTEGGKFDEADGLLVRAVALADSLHPEPHADRGTARRWLAELRRAQRRFEDAEPLLREAVDMQRQVVGAEHGDYAATISSLAHVLRSMGRPEEALPLIEEARRIGLRVQGPRHADVASNTLNLAGLLRELGRPEEAEPLYLEAIRLNMDIYGERSSHVAIAYNNYGVFLRGQDKHKEARTVIEKAVRLGEETNGRESPFVAKALANLGRACTATGDPALAERHFRRSLAIQEPLLPEDDSAMASLRADLAEALTAQGKYAVAERELLRSHRIIASALGDEHATTRSVIERIVALYEAWGRRDEAASWREKLPAER